VLIARKGSDMLNYKTYKDLYKHQASVLMQARTGCVGMVEFLFRKRVPDVLSPLCSYAQVSEIPEHVLFYCRETREKKKEVRNVIAFTALRTRKDLAQLFLRYPGLVAEWLL
jgi:hypothetical protein